MKGALFEKSGPKKERVFSLAPRNHSKSLPLLAITMGDPAGIGPEIIVKALGRASVWKMCRPLVIGSHPIMEHTAQHLGIPSHVVLVHDPHERANRPSFRPGTIPVCDPFRQPLNHIPQGRPSALAGRASAEYIRTAVRLAQRGAVNGLVTAPINKKSMHLAGYAYPGHTEFLASLTRTQKVGMMILGGPLKILFATTHVAIRDLSQALTGRCVSQAIRLAHQGLTQLFHIARPRIGIAGLNPHAGDNGLFGHEEQRVIAPAIRRAQASGLSCSGPHPADTLFGKAVRGEYDGVVAMYHDQGLVALKTVAFGHCVNLTVGLPIIRTSVDHGTAYDIVGQGTADPSSLIEAITLAARLTTRAN